MYHVTDMCGDILESFYFMHEAEKYAKEYTRTSCKTTDVVSNGDKLTRFIYEDGYVTRVIPTVANGR